MSGPPRERDAARERIAAAMVELVAERGFDAVGTEALCERARVDRGDLDRRFADLDDCFLSIHDEISAELCARMAPADGAGARWHDRLWAAGWAAMRFLREDPVRARFLIAGVNGAGGSARLCRERIMRGLADLLDAGRGEARKKPGRRSRCTAEIAAGAIYNTMLSKVESGAIERGEEFLPELIYMAAMPYLGTEAAEAELQVQPLN